MKHVLIKNELKKLKTFDLRGKNYFRNDSDGAPYNSIIS